MKKLQLLVLGLCLAGSAAAQRDSQPGKHMKNPSGAVKVATDTIGFGMFDFDLVCNQSGNGGFVGGTNGYGDLAKAQQYLLEDWTSTKVEEALFWFCGKVAESGDPTSYMTARVYAMDNTGTTTSGNGQPCPGTTLGEVDFLFDGSDTSSTVLFTAAAFPTPVYVGESFAVGFSMEGLTAGDSIGLVLSDGSVYQDFAWEQFSDGTWYSTLSSDSWDLDGDWSVYAVLDNSTIGINDAGTFNGMRLSILSGNPGTGSEVLLGYTVDHAALMELEVHNVNGQLVYNADLGTKGAGEYKHTFNTSDWNSGSYYVTVKADGRTITKKLTLQR